MPASISTQQLRSESCRYASSSNCRYASSTCSAIPARLAFSRPTTHPSCSRIPISDGRTSAPRGPRGSRPSLQSRTLAAPSAAAVVATNSWLDPHNAAALSQLLSSAGVFLLCLAAAAFVVACIPTLWSAHKLASRAEAVMKIVEQELPESASLLRLSGLEVTDCISEISRLGSDLSSGIQSTANMATMTEQGIRQGIQGAQRAVTEGLVPMAARTEQAARSALEAELQQRAQLRHTQLLLRSVGQAAGNTAGAVRRARVGMQVMQLVGAAVNAGGALRQSISRAAYLNMVTADPQQTLDAGSRANS